MGDTDLARFNTSQLPPIFRGFSSSLRTIYLCSCLLPRIPNLENTYRLHLEEFFKWNPIHRRWQRAGRMEILGDLTEIETWANLQKLTIGSLATLVVPLCLPCLHTLELIPGVDSTAVFAYVSNLSLQKLSTFIMSLRADSPLRLPPSLLKATIIELFTNARKIKVIKAPSTFIAAILSFLFQRFYSSFSSTNEQTGLTLFGDDTKAQIQLMRDSLAQLSAGSTSTSNIFSSGVTRMQSSSVLFRSSTLAVH
ncbi:hypothetical protein PIIN_09827 [Serendipita indica DSM 11827]|uniref:Uncharacterized protein n=1 Tax=Serendipita indica (strain DSM 11827) TaxID=1109443 RepID=G4TWZ6_SERID|nr:hypothetical protein PIIN_09827 [Serendipita indica DSM 11827]